MTTLLRFADLAVSRWPNRAGRKADVAAGPGWLVSIAWLDADAAFSDYSGHDRTITLIEGAGFVLDFAHSAPPLAVPARFVPQHFDGGWPASCRLLAGPCMVLNAMTARTAWTNRVEIIERPAAVASGPGARFLMVLRGTCAIGDAVAGPRDSFRLSGDVTVTPSVDALAARVTILPAG